MVLIRDSSRTAVIGLIGAAAVHASLLLITFEFNNAVSPILEKPINVRLLKPNKPLIEKPIKEEETTDTLTETVEQIAETEENEIVESKLIEDVLVGAVILNSKEFKQFIIEDTLNHINNNPDSLEGFAQSFELPAVENGPVIEKDISSLGTGMYKTTKNGKVTCHVQVILPFQNDFSPRAINTSKDCTPKKKFELDIN